MSISFASGPQLIELSVESELTADWSELTRSVSAGISEYIFKGSGDALATGLTGLINFAKSFRISRSPGYLLWVLTFSSATWAISEILTIQDDETEEFVKIIKRVMKSSKESIGNKIEVPVDFFSRPTRAPFYKDITRLFFDAVFQEEGNSQSGIKHKFDAAFTRAISEIYIKRVDYYGPLFDAIALPSSNSAELERSWDLYRSRLIYDFEVRPLFGQERDKISLHQLYIPLRGQLLVDDVRKRQGGTADQNYGETIMIDDELDRWINVNNCDDCIRLIGGGPGSGKSTTLKSLAARIAKNQSFRPLFIPLQHINIEDDLRKSVNSHFVDGSDSSFSHEPLSRASVEDGAPLVLIFDGLDEISAPGEAAREVVATFSSRLQSLIAALSGDAGRTIKVIVSGRMPAFQAATRQLALAPHCAIEARGYAPFREIGGDDPPNIEQLDQRVMWWGQYSTLKSLPTEVPEAFSSSKLEGLTNEPLLCYLLALAGFVDEDWELAADNRNLIYSTLLESVYDRGWGDGIQKRLGPGRKLSKPDFMKLMETIALAAWLGGDARVASEQKFHEAIKITDASNSWDTFVEDNGEDVANLAMNFYLKSADQSHRGFEFTHKSFGEYLTARALVSVADEISKQVIRRPELALQEWFDATHTGKPTPEILNFLRDEIRLVADRPEHIESVKRIKNAFESMISKVSDEGFPYKPTNTKWRALEIEHCVAECALWMMVNSCAVAIIKHDPIRENLINISWKEDNELDSIVNRMALHDQCHTIFLCLSHLDASKQVLTQFRSYQTDFSYSDLTDSVLADTKIVGDFINANLTGCRFYRCRISGDFRGAVLDNTMFHVSNITYFNRDVGEEGTALFSPLTFITSQNIPDEIKKNSIQIMVSQEHDSVEILDILQDNIDIFNDIHHHVVNDFVGDVRYSYESERLI